MIDKSEGKGKAVCEFCSIVGESGNLDGELRTRNLGIGGEWDKSGKSGKSGNKVCEFCSIVGESGNLDKLENSDGEFRSRNLGIGDKSGKSGNSGIKFESGNRGIEKRSGSGNAGIFEAMLILLSFWKYLWQTAANSGRTEEVN
jgi:hypothetical protein